MVNVTVVYSARKMRFSIREDETLRDLKKMVRNRDPIIIPPKFSFKLSPITGKVNMNSKASEIFTCQENSNKKDDKSHTATVNSVNIHWQDILSKKNSDEGMKGPTIKKDNTGNINE